MAVEGPSREELLEKICLLEDYILTLEEANRNKYEEICLQGRVIMQLKQQIGKMKNKGNFPPYLNVDLENRLHISTQLCFQLKKENQQLLKIIAKHQKGKLSLTTSRIKQRSSSPKPRSTTHYFTPYKLQNPSSILSNSIDPSQFPSHRSTRYSFTQQPIPPTKAHTSPLIHFSPQNQQQQSPSQKIMQLNGSTFSFSNLQQAPLFVSNTRQISPHKDSPRNFRKSTNVYKQDMTIMSDSRSRRTKI